MTKGKYAARAALRREDEAVRSDLDSYQHTIARLAAENRELRQKLAAQKDNAAQEIRQLRAQRDEGISPELSALRAEIKRQTERADRAAAGLKRLREAYLKLSDIAVGLLRGEGHPDARADAALLMAVPQAADSLRVHEHDNAYVVRRGIPDAGINQRHARTGGAEELARRLEAMGTETRKRASGRRLRTFRESV